VHPLGMCPLYFVVKSKIVAAPGFVYNDETIEWCTSNNEPGM
jgi:hypothetical protein